MLAGFREGMDSRNPCFVYFTAPLDNDRRMGQIFCTYDRGKKQAADEFIYRNTVSYYNTVIRISGGGTENVNAGICGSDFAEY